MVDIHSPDQTTYVVETLTDWTLKDPDELTASQRIHLNLLQRPVAVQCEDHVTWLRTERTVIGGDGSGAGTR